MFKRFADLFGKDFELKKSESDNVLHLGQSLQLRCHNFLSFIRVSPPSNGKAGTENLQL